MQLALDFKIDPTFQSADFFCSSSNEEAYAWVQRWPEWPNPVLIIQGPKGSGKTHLAHIWGERTKATFVSLQQLASADLLGLCQHHPFFVIDDVDVVHQQETLFHLYNIVREYEGSLLLTHRQPLAEWPITLPDLSSRLKTAVQCALHPPDDALLQALLLKLFGDYQLKISEDILAYLITHMERSFDQAHKIVHALHTSSLENKRNITLPFVRQTLVELGVGESGS